MDYCQNCDTKLESEWKLCPKCGRSLQVDEQTSRSRPKFFVPKTPIYKPNKKDSEISIFGIFALIFVLIGFITVFNINNIVGLICGIIAIVLGIISWIREDSPIISGIGISIGVTISLFGIFSIAVYAIF